MANNNDLKAIEEERETAIAQSNSRYDEMIGSVEQKYDDLQEQVTENAEQQAQIQQEQTNLALEQLEQQKEKAEKEHVKEQSNAYTDWQKQSAAYGANAEAMASMGLKGTGYAESSQVRMYTAYQSRVASAKASVDAAILSYDNGMKEAKLQNSAALAQIYAQANQQRLELALQGFQYQNQLIQEKANQELQLKSYYDSKWQNALSQINREKELALQAERDKRNYELELLKLQQEGYGDDLEIKGDGPYLELKGDGANGDREAINADNLGLDSDEVSTAYYKGPLNWDVAKFGAFSNGYQPKGISGHGNLKKTGHTVRFQTQTLSGQKQTLVQNIWEAEDGTWWRWEGRQNKYIQVRKPHADGT